MRPYYIVRTSGTSGKPKIFKASLLEGLRGVLSYIITAKRHRIPISDCTFCAVLYRRTSSFVRAKLMRTFLKMLSIKYHLIPADPLKVMKKIISNVYCDVLLAPVLVSYKIIELLKSGIIRVGVNISDSAVFMLGSSFLPRLLLDDIIDIFPSPKVVSLFGMAEVGLIGSAEFYPVNEGAYSVVNPSVKIGIDTGEKVLDLSSNAVGEMTLNYRSIFYTLKNYHTGDIIKGAGSKRFIWIGRKGRSIKNLPSFISENGLIPTPYIKVGDVEISESELLRKIQCRFFVVGIIGEKPKIEIFVEPGCSNKIHLKEEEYSFTRYVEFNIIEDERVKELWNSTTKPPVIFWKNVKNEVI